MKQLDRIAVGLVVASIAPRLLLSLATDLSPDEAYYLCAARLGVTIPDHPPATVWLLRCLDGLVPLGPVELRTRIASLVLGTVASLLLVDLVRLRGGESGSQRWASILSAWLLLPLAGGFLATPDILVFVATAALLHAEHHRSDRSAIPCATAAVVVGMLAKVVMAPIAVVFVIASCRGRAHKAAITVALLLCLPLSLRSLTFQLHHAFVPTSWSVSGTLVALVAAIVGQLLLWTPIVPIVGIPSLWKQRGADLWLGVVMTLLFIGSALIRAIPPEPNWIAPAWCVVLIAAALALPNAAKWTQYTLLAVGPALALVAASHAFHPWLPIPHPADPTARLHGWSSGVAPSDAPGIGGYGVAAERCVYQHDQTEMILYFQVFR